MHGKKRSLPGWQPCVVLLYLSRQWVPLFRGIQVPTLCDSCSSTDRWRSSDFHCRWASPHPSASRHSRSSASPSQGHHSRDRSSLSRRHFPSSMTRRLARNHSLSSRSRSPSHVGRRSSRGRHPSPRSNRKSLNCQHHYSTSRSPSPRTHRSRLSCSRSPRSRSMDRDPGDVIMKWTNIFFICVTSLLSFMPEVRTRTPHRIPPRRILA